MKKLLSSMVLLLALVAAALPASAQGTSKPADNPERGWFFFDDPPAAEEPTEEQLPPPVVARPAEPPPPPEERCKAKETWTADCGFVHPGTDFEFQAKQRDALLERMVVSQNDPKAVEAFQYYMRWVLERTAEVTNLWWYNMVQNPDLDPTVSQPISAFGLRLMTDIRKGEEKEILDLLRDEGAFFVYFSRSDCAFCIQYGETLRGLQNATGLPIRNASLDNKCMPGFTEGCMTAPATEAPAAALQVATVPTIFLYVRPNTWIRIGTGVVDVQSLVTRTTQFFSAYRSALLQGIDNGHNGRASVAFGGTDPTGLGAGVAGASPSKPITPPTEEDIAALLRSGR